MCSLNVNDRESWIGDDFQFKAKNVGGYRVELYYGTERGAEIIVWEKRDPKHARLPHIHSLSDDGSKQKAGTEYFWDWTHALQEYRNLSRVRDVTNFLWRAR